MHSGCVTGNRGRCREREREREREKEAERLTNLKVEICPHTETALAGNKRTRGKKHTKNTDNFTRKTRVIYPAEQTSENDFMTSNASQQGGM